jgi:hypothetical protein
LVVGNPLFLKFIITRYAFYLLIAILAFVIGSMIENEFYWQKTLNYYKNTLVVDYGKLMAFSISRKENLSGLIINLEKYS